MKSAKLAIAASLLAVTSWAAPAHAEWRVGTSNNFVVYSEDSEAGLRDTVVKIEKFDRILREFSRTVAKPSPLKLTIYQMKDMNAVKATLPLEDRWRENTDT